MNNKTNIEEDITNVNFLIRDLKAENYNKTLINSLENILADRERVLEENKELRKRPVFYYDNNRNTYVWCCRCADSNMSLHMFLGNGEIQGYASEH